MTGILLLDKPAGITSQTAVTVARKMLGEKRIGHCGTLDPMATGLLPLMVGPAAKACDLLMDHDKTYLASFVPGIETDTEDVTGEILRRHEGPLPSFQEFKKAAESFQGPVQQIPPMYSALKKDGQKLVDLARKGVEVERTPRTVTIHGIHAFEGENGEWMLSVHCSRGTYIRTLCADIGKTLGCGGCMGSLRRTAVGDFRLEDALTLEELRGTDRETIEKKLIPLADVFVRYPAVTLPGFQGKLYANGEKIFLSRLPSSMVSSWKEGDRFRIFLPFFEGLHSLADVVPSDEGLKLRSFIRFG